MDGARVARAAAADAQVEASGKLADGKLPPESRMKKMHWLIDADICTIVVLKR